MRHVPSLSPFSLFLFRTKSRGVPCSIHRVYRVPGFLSSRPNWVPPTSSPASECYRVPGFLSSRPNWVPPTPLPSKRELQSARLSVQSSEFGPPSLTRKRVLLPHRWSNRGDTLACGGGDGGGTQFRRRDRHSVTLTLCIPLYNPFSVASQFFYLPR
jgi:hypothetical protein